MGRTMGKNKFQLKKQEKQEEDILG